MEKITTEKQNRLNEGIKYVNSVNAVLNQSQVMFVKSHYKRTLFSDAIIVSLQILNNSCPATLLIS